VKAQSNRRRHPRLEIDIPAVIEYRAQVYNGCRILNFSRGGVYLQCLNEALKSVLPQGYSPEHKRQEVLLKLLDEPQQVRAGVVYFSHGGLGLSFSDSSGIRLFESLYARVQRSGADAGDRFGQSTLDQAQSQGILQQLRAKTALFLETGLAGYFTQAQQVLQHLIAQTSDQQEVAALFYTLNSLERDRTALTERFIQLSSRSFAELAGETLPDEAPLSDQPEEMALVETQEIDVWLLVNDVARRVESEVSRRLYQIEAALSYVCQDNIHNELNPVSPISLVTLFKKILVEYQLDMTTTRVLMDTFHTALLNDLDLLYTDLLQLLRRQKIAGLEQELQEQWTIVKTPELDSVDSSPIGHLTALSNLKPVDDGQVATPSMTETERAGVLSSLVSLSRLQASTLQQQVEKLLQEESAKPIKLSAEARAAIGAGEELVATLCKDPLITEELRVLLGSLKFLIIEAVLQDSSLLDNPNHPVRHLLDTIESLKPYVNTGPNTSLLRDRESYRLVVITEAVESGRFEHIDDVTREVEALRQEQRERFESNRKLAISRCLKDEKLRQARTATYKALSKLLLKQSVSVVVDKLLRYGWVSLLVQTAVLDKVGGKGWLGYLQIVDQLHHLFTGSADRHRLTVDQRRALLRRIHKGITDNPIYAEDARAFVKEVSQALESEDVMNGLVQSRIEVDQAYLDRCFYGMNVQYNAVEQTEEHSEWQRRVDEVALDTWLVEQDDEGRLRVLSLAWKNPQTARYLLVDGNGFKVWDEELTHLANRFARQQIFPMEASAQPIVDRTIETILNTTYDSFKQESAIDALTGLSNRRAFEAELRRHIDQSLVEDGAGILLLIDLDKFQVVNDLCGFEGGDSLLQTTTDILISYLPEQGFLARIGDDEFSLLLREHDMEAGYEAAEMLRLVIDEYAFEWKGRMIPFSISVGVVQIQSGEQGPGRLMQAAMAACSMAKQGGGNCTRIYLESDSAYQDHQQLVESLPAVKEALAKGRMELFVQPIVPLRESQELKHHHEILLRVRNEAGELEPPQEFVRVAEVYDLMRAVDRWVVEAFFRLVEPYAERLPQGQSFSINLSGKSMGDAEFKRFLTDRIKASSLQTRHLGFEITETALVGDISDTAAFINQIRDLGCTFSLDDFGSGYASFSYLKDFPVDFVKIDGIFVREILNKPADYAMINSITEIAHFMDKKVIAEYVSGEEVSLALSKLGVDYGQGYHFGKPRPLKEVMVEITDRSAVSRSR
jgi:diguanylate cyclase (GGDEF)-like protein